MIDLSTSCRACMGVAGKFASTTNKEANSAEPTTSKYIKMGNVDLDEITRGACTGRTQGQAPRVKVRGRTEELVDDSHNLASAGLDQRHAIIDVNITILGDLRTPIRRDRS